MTDTNTCILSIDVEDWFHILDTPATPGVEDWDRWPSRLERNFPTLLDIAETSGAKATCFFLGWVAHRFPHLVREAVKRGHEVASHGYSHRLAHTMTEHEFFEDARSAKCAIEDASGQCVSGYRAAGFSATSRVPWFFDKLAEAGYVYDASVFPGIHGHGGMRGTPLGPYWTGGRSDSLYEFPVSVASCFGTPMCFFGGGYLRLFPLPMIRRMMTQVFQDDRPVILYVHPREIDPEQPRLPMGPVRRFRSYVNLGSTRRKLQTILSGLPSPATTFSRYLDAKMEQQQAPRKFSAAAS